MNILKKFLLIFGGILFQVIALNWLEIQNVKPDILLVIVISVSLIQGAENGMVFGFMTGLAEDILCGGILGMNAFVKTIIGFVIGMFNEILDNSSIVTQALITFLSTLAQTIIIYLIFKIFQFNVSWINNFIYLIFPGAIYNIILIIVVFPKIKKWLPNKRH